MTITVLLENVFFGIFKLTFTKAIKLMFSGNQGSSSGKRYQTIRPHKLINQAILEDTLLYTD